MTKWIEKDGGSERNVGQFVLRVEQWPHHWVWFVQHTSDPYASYPHTAEHELDAKLFAENYIKAEVRTMLKDLGS